jgi:hypothetical protein
MARVGDQRLDVGVAEALRDVVRVIQGELEARRELDEPRDVGGRAADRPHVRLDREADARLARLGRPPAELLRGACERLLVALVRPVEARHHGQAGRPETHGELEHVAEERRPALALGVVGVVRRHRPEVGPGDAEDIRDVESATADALLEPARPAGDVLADHLRPDVRAVAHHRQVEAGEAEHLDELHRLLVRQDGERMVTTRELHRPGPAVSRRRRQRSGFMCVRGSSSGS